MRKMLTLFGVVVIFAVFSGGLLAFVHSLTVEKIEYQQLKFVKGPALKQIMKGSSNDPLADRFKIKDGKQERTFFVGVFNGKRDVVALESFGKGFDGDIGVLVGIKLENDKIVGIGVTTQKETPGVGARVKTEPSFSAQFKGKSIKEPFKLRADGGQIDAVSGATHSSQGVCDAVAFAAKIYLRLKPEILKETTS